jgi:predicted patatin/cPLA2 family phospholipase
MAAPAIPQAASPAALVAEGGAMRGVFAAGVLDAFLESGFNPFDLFLGVSAGAGNLAAYLAEMPGRNYTIFTDYSRRREFVRFARFLRGGHLMDLDWLWRITIAEMRLDLRRIYARGKPLIVVLTDVATGRPVYRQTCAADLEAVLKASSALPIVYRGFPGVDGRPMADGGLSDGLPVQAALERGARGLMVIRSRPQGYRKRAGLLQAALVWRLRPWPRLCAALQTRVERYNAALDVLRRPPPGIDVVEVCPPAAFRPSRLGRNLEALRDGYHQGRAAAGDAMARWLALRPGAAPPGAASSPMGPHATG